MPWAPNSDTINKDMVSKIVFREIIILIFKAKLIKAHFYFVMKMLIYIDSGRNWIMIRHYYFYPFIIFGLYFITGEDIVNS